MPGSQRLGQGSVAGEIVIKGGVLARRKRLSKSQSPGSLSIDPADDERSSRNESEEEQENVTAAERSGFDHFIDQTDWC